MQAGSVLLTLYFQVVRCTAGSCMSQLFITSRMYKSSNAFPEYEFNIYYEVKVKPISLIPKEGGRTRRLNLYQPINIMKTLEVAMPTRLVLLYLAHPQDR